jgi:hypothetical protein
MAREYRHTIHLKYRRGVSDGLAADLCCKVRFDSDVAGLKKDSDYGSFAWIGLQLSGMRVLEKYTAGGPKSAQA